VSALLALDGEPLRDLITAEGAPTLGIDLEAERQRKGDRAAA